MSPIADKVERSRQYDRLFHSRIKKDILSQTSFQAVRYEGVSSHAFEEEQDYLFARRDVFTSFIAAMPSLMDYDELMNCVKRADRMLSNDGRVYVDDHHYLDVMIPLTSAVPKDELVISVTFCDDAHDDSFTYVTMHLEARPVGIADIIESGCVSCFCDALWGNGSIDQSCVKYSMRGVRREYEVVRPPEHEDVLKFVQ